MFGSHTASLGSDLDYFALVQVLKSRVVNGRGVFKDIVARLEFFSLR